MKIKYIFFVLLIIFCIELYLNFNHLLYFLSFKNRSAIPTLPSMMNKVNPLLKSISNTKLSQFNFIDIGCGNCDFLFNLCKTNNFKKCIGIEINRKSYLEGSEKCKNVKNITLYNQDVLNYNFEKTPTIIYLYEPFFDIEYNTAISMYNKLFENIRKINSDSKNDIYIIYITGRLIFGRKDITREMFNKYNFEIVKEEMIGSIFVKRKIYLAKYK